MPKVFLTKEDPRLNFSPALSFGEIKVLVTRDCPVHASSAGFTNAIKNKLKDFSDEDYLLCSGDPVTIGIAVYYAAFFNRNRVNLLKWDNMQKQYHSIQVNL
tara:strand:- start:93 stop:398 length:306 start_codon:yes stop_codon:yes gene_type:complete